MKKTFELFAAVAPAVASVAGQFIDQPVLIRETDLIAAAIRYVDARTKVVAVEGNASEQPKGPAVAVTADGICTIPICGVVGRGFDEYDQANGSCDIDVLEQRIAAAAANPAVRAVLFIVNSPGGSATRVAEVAGAIAKLSEVKPTAAFVDELCASAAMWLASQCHVIYATKSAEIGSIGVYMMHMDYTGLLAKLGLATTVIKAGVLKATGALGQPLTDDQRNYLQEGVNDLYTMFTTAVRAGRSGSKIEDATMQGQCFIASKALERGLVDEIVTSVDECVAQLREITGEKN